MNIAPFKSSLRTRALVLALAGLSALTAGIQARAAVTPATTGQAPALEASVAGKGSALAAIDRQRGTLIVPDQDLDIVHSASGAIFPGSIAAFERRDARELADDERRLSLTYADESGRAVMFVHVHPSNLVPEADLASYFEETVDVIEQQNPSAYLVQVIDKTITVGGQRRRGMLGYIEYEHNGALMGKLLYLYPWNEEYYVQVSAVFQAPIEDADLAPRIRSSERFIADLERVY